MAGSPGDFNRRLQEALARARQGASKPPAAPPPPAAAASPQSADDFSSRLASSLSAASGQDQPTVIQVETTQQTGPVGQGDYVVRDGDCISSIAKSHGFFWETLWNNPGNSELKQVRKNPNVLLPGDRVTVPEKTRKDEDCAPEQRHRFRRKGEPSKIRFQLLRSPADFLLDDTQAQRDMTDQPWGDVPYKVIIDGEEFEGVSDSAGFVECAIPGDAKEGKIIIKPGEPDERTIDLMLGALSPITELAGVVERLENLGFQCGDDEPEEVTPQLRSALGLFQEQNDLEVTGQPDEATRDKLVQVHGS